MRDVIYIEDVGIIQKRFWILPHVVQGILNDPNGNDIIGGFEQFMYEGMFEDVIILEWRLYPIDKALTLLHETTHWILSYLPDRLSLLLNSYLDDKKDIVRAMVRHLIAGYNCLRDQS